MAAHRNSTQLHWMDPPKRGVLPLDSFHVPKRLRRRLRRNLRADREISVHCDRAFSQTVSLCKEIRHDSWINPALAGVYADLYAQGYAHSLEVWNAQTLVGGLFGVCLGGAFFGESMFSKEPDASKIALVYTVCMLRRSRFRLLDVQFRTPHLALFGAVEITRAEYRQRLNLALRDVPEFPTEPPDETCMEEFLRSLSTRVQP